jgi:hypothetical protein
MKVTNLQQQDAIVISDSSSEESPQFERRSTAHGQASSDERAAGG